ncbi:Phosphoglucomutase-3, partial [Chytridiales sp. JEL 0842]
MEAGFAGMNNLTVIQASQGLASYMATTIPNAKERGVVLGHDHRFNSETFAKLTASVFLHYGFKVYLYHGLVHTPMVPFGVRHLNSAGGVMITASHNPKQDNGYKVYWENGSQIIPPHDAGIAKEIARLQTPEIWDSNLPATHPRCTYTREFTKSVLEAYMSTLRPLAHFREGSATTGLKYVYTAMHGVGYPFAVRALKEFGLPEPIPVPQQVQPDPTFPTVPFPNPEEKGALNLAIETATKLGPDVTLVLANDPDGDRFAVAERQPTGEWFTFTGDQIGSILACTILSNAAQDGIPPSELLFVNSAVSSRMLNVIAAKEGCYYEETLTGFKWMGNRIEQLMLDRLSSNPKATFEGRCFAYEEAIGYMVNPAVLDKDGVSALCMFVEMAVRQKAQGGKTMKMFLDELYEKYGYHASANHYFVCRSPEKIERIFAKIRYGSGSEASKFPRTHFECEADNSILKYPSTIASTQVTSIRDLTY